MVALGNNPKLRYSTNMMEAGDARMNVGLVLLKKYDDMLDERMAEFGKITGKDISEINQWLKENGKTFVKGAIDSKTMKPLDDAIRFQGGEIAMNLDGAGSNQLSSFLNKSPLLKSFIMFPKTMLNSLSFLNKHSITSGDLYRVNTLKDPSQIRDFLATKGIDYSEDAWMAFKQETRGRVILGTSIMGYAGSMWASGNMTGNGPYDPTTNSMNRNLAEEPVRSWRLAPGMPWISYDGVEPISSLLAITVDLFENFDTLGKGRFEDILQKNAFIFADNITNKTFMQGLRPLLDVASGRPTTALTKHVANTMSISVVNQLGRVIDPAYRIVEDDFMSQMRNKYSVLDVLDKEGALPYDYNIVTGEQVKPHEFLGSSLIPVRLSKTQTRAQEILSEIEFPVDAAIESMGGEDLTGAQKSKIKQFIGKRGQFAKDVVKFYDSPRARRDLDNIRKRRAMGVNSDQLSYSDNWLIGHLVQSLTSEVTFAKQQIMREDEGFMAGQTLKQNLRQAAQTSNYNEMDRLLGIN